MARETGLKVEHVSTGHGAVPKRTSTIRSRCWACSSPPARRTIGLFINMEGFYLIPEHAKPVMMRMAAEADR